MDLSALRNYREWLRHTPFQTHIHVVAAGGWKRVFEDGVPRWASRVRNFFNVLPRKLKRLDSEVSEVLLHRAQARIRAADCPQIKRIHDQLPGVKQGAKYPGVALPKGCPAVPDPGARMGFDDTIGTRRALSGDVYIDEYRRVWFQMDPGGAVYHYGEKPWWAKGKAIRASAIEGQEMIPVFKLVSPDGTGGSRECCITNPPEVPLHSVRLGTTVVVPAKRGRPNIGAVNEFVKVAHRIVKHPVKQGSYNYAETVVEGLAAHNRFDVDTDPMRAKFFEDPPDQFEPLFNRRFRPNDSDGLPLADQKKY
jgi:hypothetical protein